MRKLRTRLALWLAPWLRQPTTLNVFNNTTTTTSSTTPYLTVWYRKEEM